MKFVFFVFIEVVLTSLLCSCSINKARSDDYLFINGHGKVISLSDAGAIIDDDYYVATDCSVEGFKCKKYGKLFAIISPEFCDQIEDYEWSGAGVGSFLMAVTPHDSSDALLSTTFGGWVSFGYAGSRGVVALYYDRGQKLGEKEVWYSTDYVDQENTVYKKVGLSNFMPCSSR